MESKWRSDRPDRPVLGGDVWRVSHQWDWWLISWWLLGLSFCLAFWALLGLILSGIDY